MKLKVLKCKNEIHEQIELKEEIKKWGNLSGYHVTSRVMVMKMANFLYFLPMTVLTKYFSAPERSSGNFYG